jgi:hypothetical protein
LRVPPYPPLLIVEFILPLPNRLTSQLTRIAVIPDRTNELIRQFKYVPYTALTESARLKAHTDDAHFVIGADGSPVPKGPGHKDERSIPVADWYSAAKLMENKVREFHGEDCAQDFAAHHTNIMSLFGTHSWVIAMEYDIRQHEALAKDFSHDLRPTDVECLTLIVSQAVLFAASNAQTTPPPRKLNDLGRTHQLSHPLQSEHAL